MSYTRVKNTVPDPLRRHIRSVKRTAKIGKRTLADAHSHPGFVLSQLPLLGELIAAVAPPKQPPILLVSLPRSGSSWIGNILGVSDGALYLREPLTQPYLGRVGRDAVPVFEFSMCQDKRAYEQFANLTFKGIPRLVTRDVNHKNPIARYPQQWTISDRTRKQIVVKEVNPLVIEYLWKRFRPKIVFLVRHPVAVLRSFHTLGWTGDQFRGRLAPETFAAFEKERTIPSSASFWEQGGAFHAIVQNRVMSFLAKVDHTVVLYEDVCENPLAEFTRIFDFCGLPFSAATREELSRTSEAKADYIPGRYSIARNTSDMRDRWKREIDPECVELVRRGYFAYQPSFYKDERDW